MWYYVISELEETQTCMKALDAERSELDEQLDMKDKTLQVINPFQTNGIFLTVNMQ